MTMSRFFQFVIGFVLGIIFFSAGIAGGAYLFLTKVAVNPSKPVFSEEKPTPEVVKSTGNSSQTATSTSPQTNSAETIKEKKEEPKQEQLPSGAYRARVTWSTGLSLRSEPNKSAERIGGVGYNWEIIILSTSDDQNWQRIRIPSSGQEGWVKAGNVEKIEE